MSNPMSTTASNAASKPVNNKVSALLSIVSLQKAFKKVRVVRSFSLEIFPGEIVGLLGPNGAGKTTAFYMTMGLITPDQGSIYFQGEEITHLPVHQRAAKGIGYLAQEPSIFRGLSVEDNILAILESMPLSKTERMQRLQELLDELHLTSVAKYPSVALSGGQRRRLEITRALATNPKLLLLDEPFANIDPLSISEVQELIRHLKARGISVLITDHNAREIFSIVDRCYLMMEGEVLLSGTPEVLINDPVARRCYLGEGFRL